MFRKPIDMLTIGDITVDAFIRMKEAKLHCKVDHESCEICMPFGAKIPYEYTKVVYAAGGAPNAAVAGSRLGLRTALISDLGRDQNGRECLNKLQKEKVITSGVCEHSGKPTNCNFILWYENDRTILVNHTEYGQNLDSLHPTLGQSPRWIYLTSLASHSPAYEKALTEYLDARPEVKLAFQPGTFQLQKGVEELKGLLKRSEVLIVNLQEAQTLLRVNENDVRKLLKEIATHGPKLVLITDGIKGSYMFDGEHCYQMPVYPDPKPALERTGCGDAFASTFISALAKGRPPLEALAAAPVNAMSVAQFVGSQEGLLSFEQLDWFLKNAPADYRPREI